ncbi:MAG: hypothetical protein HOK60_09825 [Planctomycetes bacterium]|nr:hypothetical protein [Planctomycetota bacterium]
MLVTRRNPPRSSKPFPSSEDLETALIPQLTERGFFHHEKVQHPSDDSLSFEYDFWNPTGGIAMEIMGYRADDEVYKDLLKFHVHAKTSVGVFWVPRYKWISNKKTDTNFKAAKKAVAFADAYMNVNFLEILPYDWEATHDPGSWILRHVEI